MKSSNGHILIIDDDRDVLTATRLFLETEGYAVDTESQPVHIPQLIKNQVYHLILLDLNFTRNATQGKEGFYWLHRILEIDPAAAVVLITAYGDIDMAIEAMKQGATDFIQKPWDNDKLLSVMAKALSLGVNKRLHAPASSAADGHAATMIGKGEAMKKIFSTIDKVASTDANVLILGENGTGKELVARALHDRSARAKGPFVSVDMGAISETLFESELFGHVKGAFTDAREDRMGRFECAEKGTLFLDEIGNLSLPLQAKLLSALQQRKVTRVGSNRPIDVNIRLICATNMPMQRMVPERQFRQDLLYRINTVEIHLPPLRERKEDLPLLAEHFVRLYAQRYRRSTTGLSSAAMSRLEKYHWPGNIRELQHAIERAIIMSEQDVLQPSDFMFTQEDPSGPDLQLESFNLEEVEKIVIRKAIRKHAGNITHAAHELGLTRTSLYRRIEKYGL
ncbi:MAG: sigma-54 dependent transcriptional regulator [Bacteroidia bacterium]|nr:sigma-54 dependent transcriptional regulator [Bacteroidia bacterium]